jgi:hypothetical protein
MMAETAEDLSKRPEVRKELERTTGQKRGEKIETRGHYKFWIVGYAFVLVIFAAAYFLIGANLIPLPEAALALFYECCAAQY